MTIAQNRAEKRRYVWRLFKAITTGDDEDEDDYIKFLAMELSGEKV